MSDDPFVYDENLLALCASSMNDNTRIGGDDSIPLPCWTLFQQHAEHFRRPQGQNDDSRIQNFLKTVLLVHNHNTTPRSLHKVSLNQFADGAAELVLRPSLNPGKWFQLWNDEDWEIQTLEENVTVIRLHDNESIEKAVHLHHGSMDNRRRQLHHDTHTHGRSFVSFFQQYQKLEVIQDADFASQTTRNNVTHDKNDADTFASHLDWSSNHNPDGVPIVHEAHDQVCCA